MRLAGCDDLDTSRGRAPRSTDSGNVSQRVPLVCLFAKICEPGVTSHSPAFAEAAKAEAGHAAMLLGAKSMPLTDVDILARPELPPKIQRDFEAG